MLNIIISLVVVSPRGALLPPFLRLYSRSVSHIEGDFPPVLVMKPGSCGLEIRLHRLRKPCAQERSLTAVDFALFAACGAVGCTSTHTMVIPLDVVKTRLQTNPGSYEGLAEGVVTIAREVNTEGGRGNAAFMFMSWSCCIMIWVASCCG